MAGCTSGRTGHKMHCKAEGMKEKIKEFLLDNIISGKDDISEDEILIGSGLVDSFGIVELTFFINKILGIKVKDYEILDAKADTLGKIAVLVDTIAGKGI